MQEVVVLLAALAAALLVGLVILEALELLGKDF
jgi:uncharacterized membrane protein